MINIRPIMGLSLGLVLWTSCGQKTQTGTIAPLKKQPIGKTADGQEIEPYTLTNRNGIQVGIPNSGGTIVAIRVLDRSGKQRRVWN